MPTASQPPADAAAIVQNLNAARRRCGDSLLGDLTPLVTAFTDLPPCATLAGQLTVVLNRLVRPFAGRIPVLFSSEILALPRGRALVQRMLAEARGCVAAYNGALAQFPHVRIAPLRSEPDRVELPLWYLSWQQPRQRVFADLSGTPPLLTLEDGRTLDLPTAPEGSLPDPTAPRLAPKALLLTVLLRGWYCDLFVHGKGGGRYDPVMETWWRQWTGQALAAMTVMSADLCLPTPPGVPVAEAGAVQRAVWWNHHLPHNVDRALAAAAAPADPATADLSARKRAILAHMDDDRDPRRRAAAFAELHRLNAALSAAHPDLRAAAERELATARLGVANSAFAHKRDWCFALYPPALLQELTAGIVAQLPPAAPLPSGPCP